ncbi:MAG: hypothetical protein ACREN8_12205, partial [Candidatus Dormibacteraceae bacterium]
DGSHPLATTAIAAGVEPVLLQLARHFQANQSVAPGRESRVEAEVLGRVGEPTYYEAQRSRGLVQRGVASRPRQ